MKTTEDNLIRQLCLKNEQALPYVIGQYGGLIKSVISKHLYAFPDLQEECMNDVLLGIWNNIGYYDAGKNSFKNWAAGIARFKSLDYLRRHMKELQETGWDEVVAAREDEQITAMLEQEVTVETEKLLSCLSEEDQALFLRLYVDEESIEEISNQTGMKPSAIYNRVSRGKKKIRQLFPRSERSETI